MPHRRLTKSMVHYIATEKFGYALGVIIYDRSKSGSLIDMAKWSEGPSGRWEDKNTTYVQRRSDAYGDRLPIAKMHMAIGAFHQPLPRSSYQLMSVSSLRGYPLRLPRTSHQIFPCIQLFTRLEHQTAILPSADRQITTVVDFHPSMLCHFAT